MQKDFITVTPDNGNSDGAVTVQASGNSGDARSTTITISGGGMTRTIEVNQEGKQTVTISKETIGGFPSKVKMIADKPVASQIIVTVQVIEVSTGTVVETTGTFTIPINNTTSEQKPLSFPMPGYSYEYSLNIQEDSTFRYVLNI